MAIELHYPDGATPLDPNEAAGLIPRHIAMQHQLNEWEQENIADGERWAFARDRRAILTLQFIRALHRRMFGRTWRWAGSFRTTEKNIGIDPVRIQPALVDLCRDVEAQIEHAAYDLDEIAVRFSHRLVWIHPFPNGNGRVSRTLADLLVVQHGRPRFTWGAADLVAAGAARQQYFDALHAADARDYNPLIAFARS